MARAERKTAQAWLDAAYTRFTESGLDAVRVEAIARDLGTTKGSFYWHHADRGELVRAVMARWEAEETEQIIRAASATAEPRARLRALFDAVAARAGRRGGEARLYIDAEREGVRDVVARVSRRRIDFVAGILVELGFDEREAERRGVLALAVVLGLQQLERGAGPGLTGDSAALTRTAFAMTIAAPPRE
ncbi:AcrR family transcriptional regulator [Thermocatellispora tengchongensis]|uniref:AcrR family transcriptional regulator n=1 Tax=Thermocatellispora tengchongensis TaxID=1073253 RepID=A0A840P9R3_9ACTN|nr:TetR/AcrR family transcriptional regulator [Thermocatellispora tengchongensis]MBB5134591.1 AcrR family transcriptional regulator [Thermocatellispora tengchongensis]